MAVVYTDFPESTILSVRQRTLLSSFSRSEGKQVHTTEDLFRTIQSLGLPLFDGAQIQERKLRGEGASYKVYKCSDRKSQRVVAIKQIKLPPSTANAEAFQNRVTCVLRDIVVTRHEPLAAHSNIVKLLGHGWDSLTGGSPIPFLVTEWAKYGTLREYLISHPTSVDQRIGFCRDVYSGLYEMHLCEVAHGDLKLENVLACLSAPSYDGREPAVIAKISDFGASMLLSPELQDGQQLDYRGTPGYNPPETLGRLDTLPAFDVRKCDLWTLGLLCWECLVEGKHFYDYQQAEISSALSTSQSSVSSELSGTTLQSDSKNNIEANLKQLFTLRGRLATIACLCLTRDLRPSLDLNEWTSLSESLTNLLDEDPSVRTLFTPLFYINGIPKITVPRAKLVQHRTSGYEWNFEIYKPKRMSTTPAPVKVQMLSEYQRMTATQDITMASRAKLHVAFAHGEGFGVPRSLVLFRDWARKSAESGKLPVANVIRDLIESSLSNIHHTEGRKATMAYHRQITKAIRSFFARPLLNGIDYRSTYDQLDAAAQKAAQGLGVEPIPTSIYAVHHNLVHKIPPRGARLNQRDARNGETALVVACRLGDAQATRKLLDLGADASICSFNGCYPLHWLFMFDEDEVDYFAARLTREAWHLQHLNARTHRPVTLDGQFPLILHGTPLAFATATASHQAIDVLLKARADPLIGFNIRDENWGSRSPLAIAACLHLHDILARLWDKAWNGWSERSKLAEDVAFLPHALSKASYIERRLIHGHASIHHAPEKMSQLVRQISSALKGSIVASVDFSALDTAVSVNNLNVTKALLKIYYEVDGYPSQLAKDQAFFFAIKTVSTGSLDFKESIALLDSIISQGCNINARSKSGRAVDILIDSYQGEILKWFLAKRPRLDYLNSNLNTPLHHMLKSGLYGDCGLEVLLSHGANPDIPEEETGRTPLHLAVELLAAKEVAILLNYSASRTSLDKRGNSALHCAVKSSDPDIVTLMVEDASKAALDLQDANGQSSLHLAVLQNSSGIVSLILASGAGCGVMDGKGRTPLHTAAEQGNHAALEILLPHSHEIDQLDKAGNTPLQLAIQPRKESRSHAYACVSALLEAGACPNAQTLHRSSEGGRGTLHTVFRHFQGHERLSLTKLLFKKGASLDAQDYTGTTILHLAAFQGDVQMVDYLIKSGASPHLKGLHGQTALHDCVRIMMIDGKPRDTWEVDRCKMIHLLVNAGADLAEEDKEGRTPLDLVAAKERSPLATELLKIYQARRERLVERATVPAAAFEVTSKKGAELTGKYSPLADQQNTLPFGRFQSAAWARAVQKKQWTYIAFVLSTRAEVDMSHLEGRPGIELLLYALQTKDKDLLCLFIGHLPPKPMGNYPWPTIKISQNAARFLQLARFRYEILQEEAKKMSLKTRHPVVGRVILQTIKRGGPLEKVNELVNDENGYETHDILHRGGHVLSEIWDFISSWSIEGARTGFYPDQINQLIQLVGYAQNATGGRARLQAIGSGHINPEEADVPSCAIPLGLVYEVWMLPRFSQLRLEELKSILAGYGKLKASLDFDTKTLKEIVASQIERIDRCLRLLIGSHDPVSLRDILAEQMRWLLEAITQEESKRR